MAWLLRTDAAGIGVTHVHTADERSRELRPRGLHIAHLRYAPGCLDTRAAFGRKSPVVTGEISLKRTIRSVYETLNDSAIYLRNCTYDGRGLLDAEILV